MATIAAGKPIPRDHGAKECLVMPANMPCTPENLKKFRHKTEPDVGVRRHLNSSPISVAEIEHGIKTKASLNAEELVNPPPKTLFQQKLADLEEAVYSSKCKAPLGRSHDQSRGLPLAINPMEHKFGLKTVKGDSAGMLVSPPKNRQEVEEESKLGKELYQKSHHDYDVGEMVDRNYDWSKFSKDSKYGVPTPHDNSGKAVHSSMIWQQKGQLVSKQLDDFRERTQPQLGCVHDPIAETLTVEPDHTFGVLVQPDDYDAGRLLHMSGPSSYLQCRGFDKGILSSIRHHLKKHNYTDFDSLCDSLSKLSSSKFLDKSTVQKLLFEFRVPLEPEMKELLLAWCSEEEHGVNYLVLVQIMNWKVELPADIGDVVNKNMETREAEDVIKENGYRTSSQQVQAIAGKLPTSGLRTFGIPTIRSDRPPPRIRRVGDVTNYGDESDAYGLMYPSIYSSFGVYEQEFFMPRPPDEIRMIFSNIGVKFTDLEFKNLWQKATSRDKNGQVCIESFRALLEEIQTASDSL